MAEGPYDVRVAVPNDGRHSFVFVTMLAASLETVQAKVCQLVTT